MRIWSNSSRAPKGASVNINTAIRIISNKPFDRLRARRTLLKNRLISIYERLYKFYGPQYWWPADTPFEVIVGAILTQNTAWSNVEKAIISLKKAKSLSSPSKMKRAGLKRLSGLIKPAGFYNLKAKRLANFLSFLSARYGSSLRWLSRLKTDSLREELLGINGIGPETCDSILLYAFRRPVFVVDAYTKRVFSRLKLISGGADYDEIQAFFMRNLPQDFRLFNEYHALIVRHAKERCRKSPKCESCPLNDGSYTCATLLRNQHVIE